MIDQHSERQTRRTRPRTLSGWRGAVSGVGFGNPEREAATPQVATRERRQRGVTDLDPAGGSALPVESFNQGRGSLCTRHLLLEPVVLGVDAGAELLEDALLPPAAALGVRALVYLGGSVQKLSRSPVFAGPARSKHTMWVFGGKHTMWVLRGKMHNVGVERQNAQCGC